MILGITGTFEVIIFANKKVRALFLTISRIAEISQKVHSTRTLIRPVQCMSQILTTFNLHFGRAMVGL